MVIEYYVLDKKEKIVGRHRQNYLCSICNDSLEKFQPFKNYYIVSEEQYFTTNKKQRLDKWLNKRCNKGQYTHKIPKIGEVIQTKTLGEVRVIEIIKGTFVNDYKVMTPIGPITIKQRDIKPVF